jgi:hypothetical protein
MIHTPPGDAAGDTPAVTAALKRLDAVLDPAEFATTLINSPRRLCLSVASRHAQIGDDIWADHRAYYYSWGEWIAPVSDPLTAARMISTVLRAIPHTARD